MIIDPSDTPERALRMLRQLTDFKPTLTDIATLVREVYESPGGAAGCCLHIVLDDGNVGYDSVRFCIDYARENKHPKCELLAELLLRMSKTQRRKAPAATGHTVLGY